MTELPIYYKVITHPNFANLRIYQNGAVVEIYVTTRNNRFIKIPIAKGVLHIKEILDEVFQNFYDQLERHSGG